MFPLSTTKIFTCSSHNYTGSQECPDCKNEFKEVILLQDQKDLIKLYKEYIELLEQELNELAPLPYLNGWRSTKIEEGKKLRDNIRRLEKS